MLVKKKNGWKCIRWTSNFRKKDNKINPKERAGGNENDKATSMHVKKFQRYNNNSKCLFFEKTNTINTTMVRLCVLSRSVVSDHLQPH